LFCGLEKEKIKNRDMGSYQSNVMNMSIDAISKTVIKETSNVMMKSQQNCNSVNSIQLKILETADIKGGVKLNQGQQIVCNFDSKMLADVSSDIRNEVQKVIDTQIEQFQDTTQGLFNTNLSSQKNAVNLRQYLVNEFSSVTEKSFTGDCAQTLYAANTAVVEVAGRITGGLEITQNTQAVVIGSCAFDYASRTIASNTEVTDLLTKIDQGQTVTQGLNLGLGGIIGIVVACIVGLVIVGFFVKAYKGKSKGKK
jgi:hypothetical protein